jgi:Flp pilus assembly protein TadG
MHRNMKSKTRERGAVVVTFALFLLMMLGFMSLALDFGHLFVIRTELQTSMDACALAAAQELNGQPDALARATSAGITAGNANGVDLQSSTWKNKAMVSAADISFRDQDHNAGATSATARFVRCTHTQQGTSTPLLRLLPGTNAAAATDVGAFAEATTTSAQSACPLPLWVKPNNAPKSTCPDGSSPFYGYCKGDWITLLSKNNANGQIGWANLDGSTSASETEKEMSGYCGTKIGSQLGTPGDQQTIADTWNTRFGIYKNKSDLSIKPPDFTGYVYTTASTSWPQGSNAYPDFVNKRLAFASCAATVGDCETKNGLKNNSLKSSSYLATPGTGGELQRYGTNRRLAPVAVVNANYKVVDFVCMLMLQPISTPMVDVQLEFLGNASDVGSPCTGSGLPGGSAGPLVPVLVR